MIVVTWNVLHRIHAVNWDEGVIGKHTDEHARIAAIAASIARWIDAGEADIVCLQEVSGDQLAALPGTVHTMKYPRVPRYYRHFEAETLREPAEYLAVIANGKRVAGEAYASDPGKGYLIVVVDGVAIANTHVSYGERHPAQCRTLLAALGDMPAIVCGDFNADRETCLAHLPGFTPVIPCEPALPTRPRATPSEKPQTIDHVFVRGASVVEAQVLDGGGLSDHNPVRAHISRR